MAPVFKLSLVFLGTKNLADIKTEVNERVKESKEGYLGELDPPRIFSAAGCSLSALCW